MNFFLILIVESLYFKEHALGSCYSYPKGLLYMQNNNYLHFNTLPLLAPSLKESFLKFHNGNLQCFQSSESSWQQVKKNLFEEKLDGFDAAFDKESTLTILGYNSEKLLISTPQSASPLTIHRDASKKIICLSIIYDKDNNLHIIYQTQSLERKICWLFYIYRERGKWHDPQMVDISYEPLNFFCFLGVDHDNKVFVFYRLLEEGKHVLVYREKEPDSGKWGDTVYLSTKKEEAFYPTFIVDKKNQLHTSWLSLCKGTYLANYACRKPAGQWINYFRLEIKSYLFSCVPLFLVDDNLFILWTSDRMLFQLQSANQGKNWKWGGRKLLPQPFSLCRYRLPPLSSAGAETWQSNYALIQGFPPRSIFNPATLLEDNLETGPFPQAFKTLDALSCHILNRAASSQQTSYHFQQQLEQKEKEMSRVHAHITALKGEMQNKLTAKEEELGQVKAYFKKVLKELQNRMKIEQEQKGQLALAYQQLKQQVKKLQSQNKQLMQDRDHKEKVVAQLKQEIASLKEEKKEWEIKKKGSLFFRFFHNKSAK